MQTAALALPFSFVLLLPTPRAAFAADAALSQSAPPEIDAFWEYADPAASEARFRSALAGATDDRRLELLTQIARTYSLRRRFDDAFALLDHIEHDVARAGPAPRVRWFLERGRTFNSSGDRSRALPLVSSAWEMARAHALDGLAVDAAHMAAIVSTIDAASQWTELGVQLARASADAKARGLVPALLNNQAWSLHDARRFDEALPMFEAAETEWRKTGKQPQGRIATWSVGRCLRSLKRYEEALAIQLAVEREWAQAGAADGFVYEEIAELLDALGRAAEARVWFGRAFEQLSRDARFAAREPQRLARLREKSA